MISKLRRLKQLIGIIFPIADNQKEIALYAMWEKNKIIFDQLWHHINTVMLPVGIQLKRYGKIYDGGYIMADDFKDIRTAYSFGISDDVSWDKDIADKGIKIFQFDPTINNLPENHPNFIFIKKGVYGGNDFRLLPRANNYSFDTLKNFVNTYSPSDNNLILKMDVEGYEYESLLESRDILHRFKQITLEFHFLTAPMWANLFCQISSILSQTHQLIHVHANNAGDIVTISGHSVSAVMEFTYLRKDDYAFKKSQLCHPMALDMPNIPDRQQVLLGYLGQEKDSL